MSQQISTKKYGSKKLGYMTIPKKLQIILILF